MTAPLDLPTDLDALAGLMACNDLLDVLPEHSRFRAGVLRRAEAYRVLLQPLTEPTP